MEQLTVTRKEGADYILFELSGAFNAYTAVNIQTKLYETIEKQNVVLDLANVVELDASALGVIMAGRALGNIYFLPFQKMEQDFAFDAGKAQVQNVGGAFLFVAGDLKIHAGFVQRIKEGCFHLTQMLVLGFPIG